MSCCFFCCVKFKHQVRIERVNTHCVSSAPGSLYVLLKNRVPAHRISCEGVPPGVLLFGFSWERMFWRLSRAFSRSIQFKDFGESEHFGGLWIHGRERIQPINDIAIFLIF